MKKILKTLLIIFLILLIIGIALLAVFLHREKSYTKEICRAEIYDINNTRYENFLVLYTKDHERNQYGYEILVDKRSGVVIDKGINVQLTKGTFVLSGNGEMAELLRLVEIGDIVKVSLNKNSAVISRNLRASNLRRIEILNHRVNSIAQEKKEALYDINLSEFQRLDSEIASIIDEIKSCFYSREVDEEVVLKKTDEALMLIEKKSCCIVEPRAVEGRAMWHRPNASGIDESNLDGVRKFAGHLYELGINTLYVETLWHGMTTYYSDYLGVQHPRMAAYEYGEYGNDYMLALISECHKYGIEVHAWMEFLNAGRIRGNNLSYIDPSWHVYDLEGNVDRGFLDPSNPEVREHLMAIITEMLKKYDFDGISYDYIRYSETGDFDGYIDTGFSDNSIALFREKYGYTGEDLPGDVKKDPAVREDWQSFKVENITTLVGEMTELIREVDPETVISTSPYGFIEHAKSIYMQDVADWIEKGYIDVVLPMIYTDNPETMCNAASKYLEYSDLVLQYTGVYVMYNGSGLLANQEILIDLSELGVDGNALFASQNYITKNPKYANEILHTFDNSTHMETAVSPTADPSEIFTAWMSLVVERCERLYLPKMTEEEILIIREFEKNIDLPLNDPREVADLLSLLLELKAQVGEFESPAVRDRLTEQIDYIYGILDLSISRYLLRYGYWDIEKTLERPDVYSISFDCQ